MSTIAPPLTKNQPALAWPEKHDLFGVQVSATHYDEVVEALIEAGHRRDGAVASFFAVHAVVTAAGDQNLREMVNRFDIVAPDGQPVRWALNLLYRTKLKERVYGPELTIRLCKAAAEAGVSIYLYGGSPATVEKLQENLRRQYPDLVIAGYESPPFRPLTEEEDREVVQRINDSGAGIVFIGLGCPKQDIFAAEHQGQIRAAQVCVGAAFDFHAGTLPMAPRWMQRRGLEWFYRLVKEPRRLWKRYFVTNSIFLFKLTAALLRFRRRRVT